MTDDKDDVIIRQLVQQAVQMSLRHVSSGGIPFTALVADRRGNVLGSGVNRVMEDSDPTAHAEVVAIRQATQQLRAPSLQGATLIASGEPCGMCYVTALFAGVRRVVFAVDRHGAARGGFDYRSSYDIFATDPQSWPIKVTHLEPAEANRPFEAWMQRHGV